MLTLFLHFINIIISLSLGIFVVVSYWVIGNIFLSLILIVVAVFISYKLTEFVNYYGKNRNVLLGFFSSILSGLMVLFGFLIGYKYIYMNLNENYTKYLSFQGLWLGFQNFNYGFDSLKNFITNPSSFVNILAIGKLDLLFITVLSLLVALFSIFRSNSIINSPFDETTNSWFVIYKSFYREYISITKEILSNLELGIFEEVKNLKTRSNTIGDSYSEHHIYYNHSKARPHYFLSIENKLPSSDNGKSALNKPVLNLIEISHTKLVDTYPEFKS